MNYTYRVSFRAIFGETITKDFTSNAAAERYCRQIGKPELIREIEIIK